jgi:DNA-binding GntR family transcriptional regulator
MDHSNAFTLAAATEDRLRREIFGGQHPPGTRLAEAAEARRLGVSRVPVREAFAALERDGILEFTETGRTVVKQLTPQDFEELFALRLLLEPAAARSAFPLSQKRQQLLQENISATGKAKTLDEVTRLDLEFHQLIVEASGNARLLKLWRSLRSEMELWLGFLHRQHRDQDLNTRGGTAESHAEILQCFQTRSAAACEKLMREHILGWREWLPLCNEFRNP